MGQPIYTEQDFLRKAYEINKDQYDYSLVEYVNWKTDVKIICPVHGVFMQAPYRHINRHAGCPKCRWIKRDNTCLQKYGVRNPFMVDEIMTEDVIQKAGNNRLSTMRSKYGVDNPSMLDWVNNKKWETEKINGTASTSYPEEIMYAKLVEKFGVYNVKRQYHQDKRYPFKCDFYVKPTDMFIELNLYWTHGEHWFNANSDEDIKTLQYWREKAKCGIDQYESAIYTWTIRDLLKRETATENNINYVVLWDMDEVKRFYENL